MKNKKLFLTLVLSAFSFSLVGCDIPNIQPSETNYLYIASKASKTTFNVGEAFSSSGLSILGMPKGVNIVDFITAPSDGYVFTTSDIRDDYIVTVVKTGYKSVSYTIQVVDLPHLVIATPGKNHICLWGIFLLWRIKGH